MLLGKNLQGEGSPLAGPNRDVAHINLSGMSSFYPLVLFGVKYATRVGPVLLLWMVLSLSAGLLWVFTALVSAAERPLGSWEGAAVPSRQPAGQITAWERETPPALPER